MTTIRKFDYIDALRGYAILGVVCVHALLGEKDVKLSSILFLGAKGVQLFYIVSAFTLFLSFNNRKEEKFPIRNFFIRRFFRIAPMFYISICYYLFQDRNDIYVAGDYRLVTAWSVITHFFFLHGFSAYWENSVVPGGWSIAVETTFYIICPYLFIRIKNINSAIILYLVFLFIGQIMYFLFMYYPLIPYKEMWERYLYSYFPTQFPVLILGLVAYFLVNLPLIEAIKKTMLILVPCILFIILEYFIQKSNINLELSMLNNMIVGILFLCIIYYLHNYRFKLISNSVIRFIGKISFSMYLIHFAVIYWILNFGMGHLIANATLNYLVRLIIILLFSVPISYFFYRVIELPFQNIGKKIIENRLFINWHKFISFLITPLYESKTK